MENKANYALIGMFILFALVAALGFVIWLSGAQFNKQYDQYEVAFEGGVRGLTDGSEVRFNGLGVGEVTALAYDRDNPNLVLADIQVTERTPIDVNSTARLTPLGLTGMNYIEITPGEDQEAPLMADMPGRGVKRIVGEASSVDELLDGGGNVVEAAQTALAKTNQLLSPENIETFGNILTNIEAITASVDLSDLDIAKINRMVESITVAADAVTVTADQVDVTAASFDRIAQEDAKQLIAQMNDLVAKAEVSLAGVDTTLSSFEGTSGDVDLLVADARDAINRLSNSGLTDLEETIDGMRRIVLTLSQVADGLERSPVEFIAGTEREEVVLPQ